MEAKKFTMIDEPFECIVCKTKVTPLSYTARDHCPSCLCSLHVDEYPGDRMCKCFGVLRPIEIEKGKKDNLKIVYRCDKCGMIKKNKMARDDNYDLILKIMSHDIKG
ncbi:MAG TPA: RNHCP domain-containing protein [Candidatus Caccenecus avistercoris]|nr:RNHCP domain-containing protein [Candidatus Caccenecus avistercoris]